MDQDLSNIIEALIFTAEEPVKLSFIWQILKSETDEEGSDEVPTKESLQAILDQLVVKYQAIQYPFEIRSLAGGYQFFTKPAYHRYVRKASLTKNQKRLSRSALETLSIIAYRQPITKAEMEFIRGVNCDYAVQKLLEKKLVSIVGRADAPGKPLIYATSPFFMEYFGMQDLTDLPKLKEFEELEDEHLELFRQLQAAKVEKEAGNHEPKEPVQTGETLLAGSEEGPEEESPTGDPQQPPAQGQSQSPPGDAES